MFIDKQRNIKLGKLGEEIAKIHLKKSGFKILGENYRDNMGEIDIIGEKGSILIFFEVKAMRLGDSNLIPEDNFTRSKRIKMIKICEMFIAKHPQMIKEEFGWRMDLLAIQVKNDFPPNDILTTYNNYCLINHYENI